MKLIAYAEQMLQLIWNTLSDSHLVPLAYVWYESKI